MENLCRLCAEEKSGLSSIKEMGADNLEWLSIILNLEDNLTNKICYSCLCNVEEIGFFIDKCKQSFEKLKVYANERCNNIKNKSCNEDNDLDYYSDEYLEDVFTDSNSQLDSNLSYKEEFEKICEERLDESIVREENIKIEQIELEANIENFEGKYECEYCRARFCSRLEKSEHTKEHNFFCTECGKNFTTKTKFNYHLANHKNKRNFQCSYCPKAFNHRSDLTNHLRFSHAGIGRPRKYRCELCDKKYCTPTELKVHLRFHRNERPFKCHLCDHAYVIKCHLKQHLKRHADIKDKICSEPGCGKAYRDMSSLKKHMDMHLPDDNKKYTCDVCGRKFSLFYILSDHRRKSHRKIALLQPLKKEEIEV